MSTGTTSDSRTQGNLAVDPFVVPCRHVPESTSPARAPWTITRTAGVSRAAVFTFQGIPEDAGAGNTTGFSVTDTVILKVK